MITDLNRFQSFRLRIVGATLALTLGLSSAGAMAQDATPSGTGDVDCATADATPVASPAASPAAPVVEDLQGEPVEDEVIVARITEIAGACNADVIGEIEVAEVVQYDTNLYGIEYQYHRGMQVIRMLETYSVENETWALLQQQEQSPETEEDTITVSVKIGGDPALELSPGTFAVTPAVRFNIASSGTGDLSLALFSSAGEADTEALVGTSADALPESMELVGETHVVAGATGEMLLEGIEEGTYVVVVFDSSSNVVAASPLTVDPPLDLGL